RSSTVKSPGGNNPSKPSRNPSISQPSLSAASAAPRKTALSPGQSPPLVRIPIRVFIRGKLQHLFRIDQSTGSGPLIVKLPTLPDESLAISKSIVATKNYDDEVTWKNCGVVAILDHFGGRLAERMRHSPAWAVWPVLTPSIPFVPSRSLVVRRRACICFPARLKEISRSFCET